MNAHIIFHGKIYNGVGVYHLILSVDFFLPSIAKLRFREYTTVHPNLTRDAVGRYPRDEGLGINLLFDLSRVKIMFKILLLP